MNYAKELKRNTSQTYSYSSVSKPFQKTYIVFSCCEKVKVDNRDFVSMSVICVSPKCVMNISLKLSEKNSWGYICNRLTFGIKLIKDGCHSIVSQYNKVKAILQ